VKRRILLVDDSPHAQRMGERILRDEGYEVVSVTDGATALIRLRDFEPDVVITDVSLPDRSGYDLCSEIKRTISKWPIKVVVTAGLLEPLDAALAGQVGSDGSLRKPFEASAMLGLVAHLLQAADEERSSVHTPRGSEQTAQAEPTVAAADTEAMPDASALPAPQDDGPQQPVDTGLVRAAVTMAVESAIPALIDEITTRILETLQKEKS